MPAIRVLMITVCCCFLLANTHAVRSAQNRIASSPMNIHVQTPSERVLEVVAHPSETLRAIKARIAHAAGVRANEQILLFEGRTLAGDGALEDYGIADNATLKIAPKTSVRAVVAPLLPAFGIMLALGFFASLDRRAIHAPASV